MEPNSLKWVGSPCGLHGPYVFYKAFKFHLEGKPRILSLGDFFFVRCKPGDPICIAELQLLWEERTTKQLLSSSKLYFLPEDTPQGRTVNHGEDELVAVSEKVIVKLDNLVKWTVRDASQWRRGLRAEPLKPSVLKELGNNGRREALHKYRESTLNSGLNFKDVLREKAELGDDEEGRRALVLSYPQYCRYRSVVARLRERPSSLLMDQVVLALGGIASLSGRTRILYCRDTFEHPTLIQNESISEEFAPNLKGRPRKKKPSISQRRDSQGPTKDAAGTETAAPAKVKSEPRAAVPKPKSSGCKKAPAEREGEEQAFLVSLYKYMKERGTPIERIPYLGFKQINLWTMFQAAQKLGGYESITARRQWKHVYDELGGNPGSTSAATCTRRHYERLLLPYERHIKGEEDRPLPLVKPKRPDPGVQEGTGGRRPKAAPGHKAPGETESPPKSPPPSPDPGGEEESAEPAHPAKRERKSEDEEEEELQLTVKKETPCGDAAEEKPPPGEATARLSGDEVPPQGYPETQARAPPDQVLEKSPFCQSRAGDRPPAPPTAREAAAHVGRVLPTPQQSPPQAGAGAEAPADQEEEEEEEEDCRFGCRAGAPPGGNGGIMSPLAKKKLLSQVSGCATAGGYPFAPPPAVAHGDHRAHGPGAAVSRPSVIRHAQSLKALGNRKQEVTSELFQWDPAQPRPTAGPYPAERRMGHPSHGHGFPNFYAPHPLLSLYRQGEHVLSGGGSFTCNGGTGPRFAPNAHPDCPGSGYCPPLMDEDPPCGEEPSDDQPTDLSLPKPFPHKPSPSRGGKYAHPHPHPAPHWDSPHSGLDYHPKACRVPPMAVSAPRKPLDPPPPPRALGKDSVPGRRSLGPAGWGPQCVGTARPLRRTLEELEKGPPEKKIRAVSPMHPARARSPDPEAKDQPGDGFTRSLKFPVGGPLYRPLYAGAEETCDRLAYPHPLQRLKSQPPLLPPLALHSLMVQRHLLASAAAPHLYRHPGGATYGDLLHHGLFPMSALHPPPGFSTPQLPSLHPSTKL
ncbi:AT-rich interactive domain-containing protein 5B-like [Anguilla anguilla]|uniref:AT-rich interactive domain-containing protein 5B-like n=1 Tax=Anguilla anguilla TaxID=7936 RepID=UPI0015B06B28|nr:AT-rich interactive domain-containing protein 5B-like [Anguilla anguilla]